MRRANLHHLGCAALLAALALGAACGERSVIFVHEAAAPGGDGGDAAPPLQISGWHPYWAGQGGEDSLAWAGSDLQEVNPTWYGVLADGSLKLRGDARDTAYVQAMQAAGREVLPMIDDFEPGDPGRVVMADPALRAAHIAAILHEVDTYGYDGVDIDYEGLTIDERDGFSAFMTDLAAELHARGKVLSAALWAKTQEPGTGARASQDWPVLGQVVDRFKIMCYGWGWPGGPARPIGPLWWNEEILQFALSVVPAERIYVAIPFFGYRWPSTGERASSLTYQSAEQLRADVGATALFDAYHGEASFTYTDGDGVSWEAWYQTPESVELKVRQARELGIGGVAIWRLGGESAAFWDAIARTRGE